MYTESIESTNSVKEAETPAAHLTKDNNDNILYLNRLRVLASLFVVIIHVCAVFYDNNPANSSTWIISIFYNSLARTAVPLFVFVSGAVYLNENKKMTYKKTLLTVLRFVVMFLIWDFIYYALSSKSFTFDQIIVNMVNYKYHLWYLLSYILLLALVPVLKLICKKENKSQVKYLLTLFLICTATFGLLKFFVNLFDNTTPFMTMVNHLFDLLNLINFGELSSLILLFISGWYFSTFDFFKNKKLICIGKWLIGILAPICVVLLSFVVGKGSFGMITRYYYLPNYILTVCIFLTFRYSKSANTKNKFFDFIAKNTLAIYLIHVIFIDLATDFAQKHFAGLLHSLGLIWIIPLMVLSVYVISLTFSIIINLLPKKIRKWIC